MELKAVQIPYYANFTPPPVLNSSDYNVQLTAVSVYGSADSTVRTDDQVRNGINLIFLNHCNLFLELPQQAHHIIMPGLTR